MMQRKKLNILSYGASIALVSVGICALRILLSLKDIILEGKLASKISSRASNSHIATPEITLKAFLNHNSKLKSQLFWDMSENASSISGKGIFQGDFHTNYPIPSKYSSSGSEKPLIFQRIVFGTRLERGHSDPQPRIIRPEITEKHAPYFLLCQPKNSSALSQNSEPIKALTVNKNERLIFSDDILEVLGEKVVSRTASTFQRIARFFDRIKLFSLGVQTGTSEKELGITLGSFGFVYGSFVFDKSTKSFLIMKPQIIARKAKNLVNPLIERLGGHFQQLALASIFLFFSISLFNFLYQEIRIIQSQNSELRGPAPISIVEAKQSLTCACGLAQKSIMAMECGHLISCENCQHQFGNICPVCRTRTLFSKLYVVEMI